MTNAGTEAPPRPVAVLQVGVTGHRALPRADTDALRAAAAGILRDLAGTVRRLHATDAAAPVPLYAPAEPVLRCVCGLAEGADALLAEAALAEGWSLVVVLPFPHAEFERDFAAGPALSRFRALLARADTVCELDGVRGDGAESYAAVGEVIVEQSDLLLAVWDGMPARGPGGTGDVVRLARDRGLPVAVLAPESPAAPAWHGAAGAAAADAALLPPPDPAGFPQAFLQERPRRTGWASRAVRLFERTVLLGGWVGLPPPPRRPPMADAPLLRFFAPADRMAVAHAARFRAAGLLRYGLILPATLGSFIGFYGAGWLQGPGFLLQFAALVAVLLFSARGWWEDAQRRFVSYRALAEQLRNARLLLPLGAVPAPLGTPAGMQAADWTAWYARAATREAGLPAGRLDAAAVAAAASLVRTEAENELDFLRSRAARFSAIARRLKRVGVALFMCGVAGAAIRAVLLLAGAGSGTLLLVNELALALPALAPVFLGLLSFGEYGRLAARYQGVAAVLAEQVAALDGAFQDGVASRAAVLAVARRIADTMLAEGADWQMIIRGRTVSAY